MSRPFSYSTSNQPNGIGGPLQAVPGGPQPFFRSAVDASLSMWRRTPEAEYPDGYLGTIRSRRDDRMLDALKGRINERSYQRGVHKGERIDPGDYHWSPEWNPMTGLRNEAAGIKTAPLGEYPTHLTKLGKMPQPIDQPVLSDPKRVQQLARLLPSWS